MHRGGGRARGEPKIRISKFLLCELGRFCGEKRIGGLTAEARRAPSNYSDLGELGVSVVIPSIPVYSSAPHGFCD
jgi:hypothetical protein